jgi:DNA-binding winged helix-turn-helix (wHTH) protein/DNA-directed RNA polymerase specialized sigma24 family protein
LSRIFALGAVKSPIKALKNLSKISKVFMSGQPNRIYKFGKFSLNVAEGLLLKDEQPLSLTPKAFDLLVALVENNGRLLHKKLLMKRLWPNSFVEEANLTQYISILRKALGNGNDGHQYIETIPTRGYRFTATVKEIVQEVESSSSIKPSEKNGTEVTVSTYSDAGYADNRGQYVLVISATIKDVDKPIAAAIEAHLRKLSKDVTLTILRIEDGSVILILEGTRAGFERIRELVESGQLSEIFGFDVVDLRWGLSPERVKLEPRHTVQSYPEESPRRKDRSTQTQPAIVLTEPAFDKLLLSLDVDRERAAIRYEEIRQRLIKLFEARGASYPEELADETIDRVARKVEDIADMYVGDPVFYFYGVARNVYREHLRSRRSMPALQMLDMEIEDDERKHECLEKCLLNLSVEDRTLLLKYYESKESKIGSRKQLAVQLGIAPNALRLRVHRIRSKLGKCVSDCME